MPGPRQQRQASFSSRSSGGRRINRPPGGGRGSGGRGWSGSTNWSPYGRNDRLWPKVLAVLVIVLFVLGGSVAIAGIVGNNQDDTPAAVTGDPTESPTTESEAPTETEGDGEPTATEEPSVTATPVDADSQKPSPAVAETATPVPSPSPTPLDPESIETARDVAESYAEAWSSLAYDQLYDLISSESQQSISREDFVARYEAIAVEAGIVKLNAEIVSGDSDALLFPMNVEIESSRIGKFTDENQIPVINEDGEYKVDWSPSLIFSGLGKGYVRWTSEVPERGRILDRKGRPLAEMGFINKVGVVPGQVTNEEQMLQKLSELINMPPETIKSRYQGGEPNWFMPVKDFPDDMDPTMVDKLGQIKGVVIQEWPARVYPAGAAAAHIVGYMSEITAEELPELAKKGYEPGDMIGRAGIEAYAEDWLSGKRGGSLALVNQDGSLIRVLGEVEPEPAKDVVLTIDIDLQIGTYHAIGERAGSAVVMDPRNGQILAMASRPSFDPNKFIRGISQEDWNTLNNPELRPMVNRATAEATPSGSVFKLISGSAAIKHLGYTADTPVNCPATFSLPGNSQTWSDWVPGGQGQMNFHTAIYRSCNTVFYKIGAELDRKDPTLLPDMAKAYGFGQPSGLESLYDVPGTVPSPEWKQEVIGDYWARGDAVNLAIGQGYFTGTPLQFAKAYAAITNGGTLWRPYLVLDVVDLNGNIVFSNEPEEMGQIPLSPEQLQILKDGMYDVIHAPDGTAVEAFQGANYEVSGKTGTAETDPGVTTEHAWFGAFAPSDDPQLTVMTMAEHGGFGSQAAAPIARKIFDEYFKLYPQ